MSCLEKKGEVRFQRMMGKAVEIPYICISKRPQFPKSCPAFMNLDSTPEQPHNLAWLFNPITPTVV